MIIEKIQLIGRHILTLFSELAPFLLLGFLLAGLVYVLVPKRRIRQTFGGSGLGAVIKAALVGVPLPLCSCGTVPMALSLRKQGASRGATVSFLISTPETGVDSILITYGLLGPVMMIFRPIAAFATAVFCGLAQDWLPSKGKAEGPAAADDCCVVCNGEGGDGHGHSTGEKAGRVLRYAFVDFLEDTAKWLVIGIVLAGVIGAFLTPALVSEHFGSPLYQMGLMLLVGIPMYTCASASTPVAAAFIAAGFTPGAALVYLLVGPATSAATVTLVARFLGKRAAALYLLSIATVSVGLGLLLDFLVGSFGWRIGSAGAAAPGEVAGAINVAAAVLLAVLLGFSLVRGIARRRSAQLAG
jgi:uncharacterized membrane protein YraQ (UPF0718 family)